MNNVLIYTNIYSSLVQVFWTWKDFEDHLVKFYLNMKKN
jgi:hypothetical protein